MVEQVDSKKSYYLKSLEDLYKGHSKIIIRNSQFLGYGILIALFHYGKYFFITHSILACTTALFSITSLLLVYALSVYYFISAKNIRELDEEYKEVSISSCNESWIKPLYFRVRSNYMRIF